MFRLRHLAIDTLSEHVVTAGRSPRVAKRGASRFPAVGSLGPLLPRPSESAPSRLSRVIGKIFADETRMEMRVREWMRLPVISVRPRDSTAHARAIMEQHRVNQLPVCEGPRLVGIVTDRDLRDAFPSLAESTGAPSRRRPKSTDPTAIPVEDVMTRDILTVEPDTPLADAARLLRRERIGALPVVAGGHAVGILARSDLLDALVQVLVDDASDRSAQGSTSDGFG